jgi:hypothetical protein
MDFSALDQFNAQISNYAQTIGLDTGDIETTLNDKIEALKQKGQDLLEGLVPAEALIANPGGLGLTELATAGESLLGGVGSGLEAVGSGVVTAARGIATGVRAVQTAYQNLGDATSDTSIRALASNATRVEDAVPESIELSNLSASDAVSSAVPGLEGVAEIGATEAATTAATVGADVGATAGIAGALETVGAGADATGIGAVLGIPLQIIGLALGGYSLFNGIEDMFSSHHSPDVASLLPNIALPQFQAS